VAERLKPKKNSIIETTIFCLFVFLKVYWFASERST
jgi:hypothetical protein